MEDEREGLSKGRGEQKKKKGADQMSFCWKTPEGYLFGSQQRG